MGLGCWTEPATHIKSLATQTNPFTLKDRQELKSNIGESARGCFPVEIAEKTFKTPKVMLI